MSEYEINVAIANPNFKPPFYGSPYLHHFRVQLGIDEVHAKEVLKELCEKYPSPAYHVSFYKETKFLTEVNFSYNQKESDHEDF